MTMRNYMRKTCDLAVLMTLRMKIRTAECDASFS